MFINRPIFKIILFVAGVMLLSGGACPSNDTTASNKVAQSEIYQSYSVSESGGNYEVKAYFRVGGRTGTTLALVTPSKAAFNGQPMKENLNTSSGTFYSATVPSSTTEGTFTFSDRDGKVYTNKVDLARVALGPKPGRATNTANFTVPLTGAPAGTADLNLQLNRQMVMVGTSPSDSSEAYYDSSKNQIVVMPAAWKDVAGGNVKVDLGVRRTTSVEQGTKLGGEIVFEYDSAPVSVAFVKSKVKTTVPGANRTAKNVNKATK